MSTAPAELSPSDKVVCIDATPIPHFAGTILDYEMPGGMLEEGAVYAVERMIHHQRPGVAIVGVPVITRGIHVGWSPCRFRRIEQRALAELSKVVTDDLAKMEGGAK